MFQYRWISRDFVEIRKLHASYLAKGIIAGILILLAIVFAVLLFTATDAGGKHALSPTAPWLDGSARTPSLTFCFFALTAVVEWTIAFGFTFYLLTFFWDLRMSKGVHRGELSRPRILAMKQNGQNVTAIREANEAGGGDLPAGMNQPAQGYPHGAVGSDGHANGGNGYATYGQGYPTSTHPANGGAANEASAAYAR